MWTLNESDWVVWAYNVYKSIFDAILQKIKLFIFLFHRDFSSYDK